jgi:hypothetical protein
LRLGPAGAHDAGMLRTARILLLGAAACAVAIAPAAASARHGGDDGGQRAKQRVAGSCTARSSAKLKAKTDDGRLEVEFEVDQNRDGVPWRVRIRRDGHLVVATRATTRAPSGSFSVERRIADPPGSHRVVARATSPSGEVCRAALTI